MKAYIFPGQGAQFVGMGSDLYQTSAQAKQLFEQANAILGFDIDTNEITIGMALPIWADLDISLDGDG